jgi:hypothetical protein
MWPSFSTGPPANLLTTSWKFGSAVYTLRQITEDFPDLSEPTFELLTAYLRESAKDYGDGEPPVDVREIINILRNRLVTS